MMLNFKFYDSFPKFNGNIALTDGKYALTYKEFDEKIDSLCQNINKRTLVFCICKNEIPSVVGYIGFLRNRIVPVMISSGIDKKLFDNLYAIYKPEYVWAPDGFMDGEKEYSYLGYSLIKTNNDTPKLFDELALLLTTSGSTGSPKLVRISYDNLISNTKAIVEYLNIKSEDRAITTLPMNYTYGISIINSHLAVGARIILTDKTLMDKGLYELIRKEEATTFGGVPYTYEMLKRLRFLRMELPSLKYLTQAGGKLGKELHYEFATGLKEKGIDFIVMYGQTEATARMSYVPKEFSVEKAGSIGIAIPNGRFEIIDANDKVIEESNVSGELVYYGENVTLGYAEKREDLEKGDERAKKLVTGDMALRDEDGFYYITGRKKRFLKMFGNRVSLDEIEELLKKNGFECACVGSDDHMVIYTVFDDLDAVKKTASGLTGLNGAAFTVKHIDEIPRNDSGKVLYSALG